MTAKHQYQNVKDFYRFGNHEGSPSKTFLVNNQMMNGKFIFIKQMSSKGRIPFIKLGDIIYAYLSEELTPFDIMLRFFGFGGPAKKKMSTAASPSGQLQQQAVTSHQFGQRKGSDRSPSGSVHELAVSSVKDMFSRVIHSHSQSNLSDIPYR